MSRPCSEKFQNSIQLKQLKNNQVLEIRIQVTPNSKKPQLVFKNQVLAIYVSARPVAGEANLQVQKELAKFLGLAKTQLNLVKGNKSKQKVFQIATDEKLTKMILERFETLLPNQLDLL